MDNNRYIDFEAYIEPDKSFLTLFFRNLILGKEKAKVQASMIRKHDNI